MIPVTLFFTVYVHFSSIHVLFFNILLSTLLILYTLPNSVSCLFTPLVLCNWSNSENHRYCTNRFHLNKRTKMIYVLLVDLLKHTHTHTQVTDTYTHKDIKNTYTHIYVRMYLIT